MSPIQHLHHELSPYSFPNFGFFLHGLGVLGYDFLGEGGIEDLSVVPRSKHFKARATTKPE